MYFSASHGDIVGLVINLNKVDKALDARKVRHVIVMINFIYDGMDDLFIFNVSFE